MDDSPIDLMAPWTIKSVPVRIRDKVTAAARREGLTVGQWLERRVDEWDDAGSPVSVSAPLAPVNLGELAQAMEAVRALATAANVPVPPQLARDGLSMIRQAVRQAKGLARRRVPARQAADGLTAPGQQRRVESSKE